MGGDVEAPGVRFVFVATAYSFCGFGWVEGAAGACVSAACFMKQSSAPTGRGQPAQDNEASCTSSSSNVQFS